MIIFCCFLWNIYQKYLSAKYVSKLLCGTNDDCYFFMFFYFPSEVVHLGFPPHIFSVSGKFGVCYSTCQWGECRIKERILLYIFRCFLGSFCCFSYWNLCFYPDVRSKYDLFIMRRKWLLDGKLERNYFYLSSRMSKKLFSFLFYLLAPFDYGWIILLLECFMNL